jgi:hypothetical protein
MRVNPSVRDGDGFGLTILGFLNSMHSAQWVSTDRRIPVKTLLRPDTLSASRLREVLDFGYVTATGREGAFFFLPSLFLRSTFYTFSSGSFTLLCLICKVVSIMAARLPLARLSGQRLTTLTRATRAPSRLRAVQGLSTFTRANASPRASGLLQASSG